MRTQTRLCAPGRDSTQRSQNARSTQGTYSCGRRERGRDAIEDNSAVVEDVSEEAIRFAFRLER